MTSHPYKENRFSIVLILLVILGYGTGHSQSVVSGTVEDDKLKGLSGATVMISQDSTSSILAYGISSGTGNFKVQVDSALDSLYLKISYIGYSPWTKTISNQDQQLDIRLHPSTEPLREVLVEARNIEQREDTLAYSVAAFKGEQDRVIADVIKRMPGITVMPNGQIRYKGDPIEKYYIEGLDMLEGRYGLANNNLSADDVDEVQVLENHQPIKVLDSLEFSERASLNIKLKNEITYSGSAEIGLGFSPLLREVNLTPMLFTKKRQAIVSYQTNNTGKELSRQITNFYFQNPNDFNIDKTNWLWVQRLGAPPFSRERWLDNDSHLGSVNLLQRLKNEVDLKVNVSYLSGVQKQQGASQTQFFTPSGSVNVSQENNNSLFVNSLQSEFTIENNNDKNYLKNQLVVNASWDSQRGLIHQPENDITQHLKTPFTAIQNRLRVLRTLGKQLITFRSNTGYTSTDQELKLTPGPFPELFNQGQDYGALNQVLESHKFFTDNSAGFTKALGRFTLSPKLGFSIQSQRMESDLIKGSETSIPGADFRNRLDFVSSEVYFKNSIRYRNKQDTWNIRLSTPFSLKSLRLKDDHHPEQRDLSRFIFAPNLFLKHELSAFWTASLTAGLNFNFGDIQNLYYGFLLTNYRNLQRYDAPISQKRQQRYSGSFSYRNPLDQLFFNGAYSYSRGHNNLLYKNDIGQQGELLMEAVERDNVSQINSFELNASKYFGGISSTLKLNAQYNLSQREQLLNGELTTAENNNLILRGSFNSEIFSWLSAEADTRFSSYELAFENVKFQQVETIQHQLGLFVFPKRNQFFSTKAEYYHNSLTHGDGDFFLNLGYRYTLASGTDLNLNWNNVLNTDEFTNAYTNEFSYVESRYRLRPSQLLLSLKFSF